MSKLYVVDDTSAGVCYRCEKPLPADGSGTSAVHIDGGYGLFHDNIETQCRITSYLCHDCNVELFRWFELDPRTMTDMRGLHPYMDAEGKSQDEPCCEYAWNPVKDPESGRWEGAVKYGYEDN